MPAGALLVRRRDVAQRALVKRRAVRLARDSVQTAVGCMTNASWRERENVISCEVISGRRNSILQNTTEPIDTLKSPRTLVMGVAD